MSWIRSSPRAEQAPASSISPDDVLIPAQRSKEAFNLIEVFPFRGGFWKAMCECGEAPQTFPDEPGAWQWVASHRCPVIEVVLP